MCTKSCVAFMEPFKDMDTCPMCNGSRYDEDKLAQSDGQIKIPKWQFDTYPIGPQLQALKCSPQTALALRYLFDRTRNILEGMEASNEVIEEYDDICQGEDILCSFHNGNIGEHDFVLMLSVDGAQLYQSKQSDCWIYIWVILNLSSDTRYQKKYVLPGGIFPSPEKPKNLDSFLFPDLHHLSALQKEGLRVWDRSLNRAVTSWPFFTFGTADAVAMASLSGFVGHHGGFGCRLFCGVKGRHKPEGPHYYPAALQPDPSRYNVPGSSYIDIDIHNLKPANMAEYQTALVRVRNSPNPTQYKQRRLETGIVKPSLFSGIPHALGIIKCFPIDIMHVFSLNISEHLLNLWRGKVSCEQSDSRNSWD